MVHSTQTLDRSINMAIESLVKYSAKSETEERGPHKILTQAITTSIGSAHLATGIFQFCFLGVIFSFFFIQLILAIIFDYSQIEAI